MAKPTQRPSVRRRKLIFQRALKVEIKKTYLEHEECPLGEADAAQPPVGAEAHAATAVRQRAHRRGAARGRVPKSRRLFPPKRKKQEGEGREGRCAEVNQERAAGAAARAPRQNGARTRPRKRAAFAAGEETTKSESSLKKSLCRGAARRGIPKAFLTPS